MRDKIIQQVVNKIQKRSDVGFKKYGVTLFDDNQPLDTWLNHLQEELMDAVNYIEKARMTLREEIEDCYIKDLKVTNPELVSAYPDPGPPDQLGYNVDKTWTTSTT
jgi:nucleoid-associated protein YejK